MTYQLPKDSIHHMTSPSFDNALVETAEFLKWYFTGYLPRRDVRTVGPMTLLKPAFNAFVPNKSPRVGTSKEILAGFELRSRPNMLQYNPMTNMWISHTGQASTELNQRAMERLYLKQLFHMYTLRHCADHDSFNTSDTMKGSFRSSYYAANQVAPMFIQSLNDKSVSVSGNGFSVAHFLPPRMIPVTIERPNVGTIGSLIGSVPCSGLRGAFINGTPSLDDVAASAGNDGGDGGTGQHPFSTDKSALEYPYLLPAGAALLSDMEIGRHLFGHCAKVVEEVVGDPKLLSKAMSVGDEKPSLKAAAAQLENQVGGPVEPVPSAASDCYREACSDCRYFKEGFCKSKKNVPLAEENIVFNLSGARSSAKKQLYRSGFRTASQLTNFLKPGGGGSASSIRISDKQQRYIHCVANNLVAVHPASITAWLGAIRYPLIAIDFEAAAFALPRYSKIAPYRHVPFQFTSVSYTEDPFKCEKGRLIPPVTSPLMTSYCAIGSKYHAIDDPRAGVGEALMSMITEVREAQKVYNFANPWNPAMTTHTYLKVELAANKVPSAKKPAGKKVKGTTAAAAAATIPPPAPKKFKNDSYKVSDVTVSGLHTMLSSAKNAKISIHDPFSHGCLIGHSVSFERGCFQTVSSHCGELSGNEASNMFASLVFMDTRKLVMDGLVHPLSHGSNSLKQLVPALVPTTGDQYGDLDISDGQAAAAAFRDWVTDLTQNLQAQHLSTNTKATLTDLSRTLPDPQADYHSYERQLASFNNAYDKKREELIKYCETDTLQMVSVVREISRICSLATSMAEAKNTKCVNMGQGWLGIPLDHVTSTRLLEEKKL
eukprot:GILJ01022634.1.p1 GENE.GILJ01022634.1~~GILJ01022634.1.p1  ORF type:complete len:857 (+),score=95.34 GILJ01022634.1:92-2572(+)